MSNTTDNSTYYIRNKSDKEILVYDFIKNKDNIEFIYDVGCNNGNISYPLQTRLNKRVLGVDLSADLIHPADYDFKIKDIVSSNDIIHNDCTLFFSLYHHLLGSYGIETTNDVFLKLLLRTKYLIFDTGNVSEISRQSHNWYKIQKNIFPSESSLMNHFGLPYTVLGNWKCGGGTRSVVVFSSNDFDTSVDVIQEYRRLNGTARQKTGLIDLENCKNVKQINNLFVFKKLKWNDKILFSKKRPNNVELERKEYENIIKVYNELDASNLIKFYGYSEKFGLIFEWLDDFKYIGKTKVTVGDIKLKDVDIIELKDGTKKYIDFER
jgi:hypothetical protein